MYGQISQTEGERDFLLKKIGFGFRNKVLFPGEGGHIQYFGREDWDNFALAIKKKLEKKKNWLKEYAKEVYKLGKEIVEFLKQLSEINFSTKTNKELLKYYRKFENYRAQLAYLLYPHLVIEKVLEERLREELKKELQKRRQEKLFDEFFSLIAFKTQINESDEEEEELLEIAKEFVAKGKVWDEEVDRKLQKHAKKYGWLPYYGYGLPVGDKGYFRKQLSQIEDPARRLNEKTKGREAQKEALKNLKKDFEGTSLGKLIELIQTYLHLRVYRTEVLRKSYYYARDFLEEIGKRMRISLDDSFFLTPKEIRNFLEKGVEPSIKKIKERKMHYAIVMIDGKIELISKKKEIEALGRILRKQKRKTVLKGTTAYPGIAKGEVKIIKSIKNVKRLKEGEILVTSMTTPEMTIAIHKAAAIVTDEGGITCHAAIISRELKIPCVIATKVATKLLKDGDLVEVDAKKGVVKILKRLK